MAKSKPYWQLDDPQLFQTIKITGQTPIIDNFTSGTIVGEPHVDAAYRSGYYAGINAAGANFNTQGIAPSNIPEHHLETWKMGFLDGRSDTKQMKNSP